MGSALARRRLPVGVRSILEPLRKNSLAPVYFSSSPICRLTAGWVMPNSRAAAEKLLSLAAATNTLSLKSSTTISFNAYL